MLCGRVDVRWTFPYLLVLVGRTGVEDNEGVICRRCSAERTLMPDRDCIDRLRVVQYFSLPVSHQ